MQPLTQLEQNAYNQSSTCHRCEEEIISTTDVNDYDEEYEEMKKDNSLRYKRKKLEHRGPKG